MVMKTMKAIDPKGLSAQSPLARQRSRMLLGAHIPKVPPWHNQSQENVVGKLLTEAVTTSK